MSKNEVKLKIKAFDLFSGVGGFRSAAISDRIKKYANVDFVGFCEIDDYAVRTYKANFNVEGEYFKKDVNEITKLEEDEVFDFNDKINLERVKKINSEMPDFDLLMAGFPCQPYSLMGNREGIKDDRGSLLFSIREILRAKRPKYFILENVRAIKSVNGGQVFAYIKDMLENELDYKVSIFDLNSSDFGVPQTRRRTYFVGIDDKTVSIEEPQKVNLLEQQFPTAWHLLEREVDQKYFLSEKIKVTILADEMKGYKRKAEINKLIARPLTMTMHKMHRASQDNYYSLSFINGKYDTSSNKVILSDAGHNQIRRLTPLEAFRLQGFSDHFVTNAKQAGLSDTRLYMQSGNTVTVSSIESILEVLFKNNKRK
jgi:DNA (cytosine-5)-methyltransferase 1